MGLAGASRVGQYAFVQVVIPERSRGIPLRDKKVISRDPSTAVRSAQDDSASISAYA